MNNQIYWVWLCSLSGIFSNKITALLENFESVVEIYMAKMEDYKNIPGISRGDALVLNSKDLSHAKEIIEKTEKNGAYILTYDDIDYPDELRKTDNPPYLLYVKGERLNWDRLFTVGVVGTRRCSAYGTKAAKDICFGLAGRGITIVSGMARGIDSIAAKAALDAGGKTIAVLGSGLDVIYPPENRELMEKIEKSGAVISEYPPGSQPMAHHFPERNRIISGLSRGVLVIEAPLKSGALITANYALESGRDLFAVPGEIFNENSKGCNLLIKQGAKIVSSVMDIIEEYPADVEKLVPPENFFSDRVNNVRSITIDDEKYQALDKKEQMVISLLIEKNMHIDDIIQRSGIDAGELNAMLPMLEMLGLIRKLPGDNYKLEV